ncbi:MAG: tRNA pseudouridine(55) synthase TruB [Pontimonas sp.]|nr:tRNA pseudouridine(55) synthase TruB [Pontimonas sp.]
MASGIVLVDKPLGLSSHSAVSGVRKALGTKKVGHAGTLDPAATGLLVMGVNAGTRLLTYLVGLDKSYTATMRLGYETTTDDAEGDRVGESSETLETLTDDEIRSAVGPFRGDIEQVPSTFSAIKIDGKRAYDLARAGQEVELKSRAVTISRLEASSITRGDGFIDVELVVDCSSGTYIRALARDIGRHLGVGGHLVALRRTRVGPFGVEGSPLPQDVQEEHVMSLAEVASQVMPVVSLAAQEVIDISHGRPIRAEGWPAPGPLAALAEESGALVAILEASGGRSRILMGVPDSER